MDDLEQFKKVENLIRTCLIECGADKPGCAWSDPNLGSFFFSLA